MRNKMSNPNYKFALREDLKDNKEFLPTRAHDTDTGWDVRAAMSDRKPLVLKPLQKIAIPLGFRGFCPGNFWYELKPRSSTFGKKSLHALYGTIDETYEGELVFACQYIPALNLTENYLQTWYEYLHHELTINFGDAIGQLIPVRRQEMEVINISNEEYNEETKRRDAARKEGGFGSTGA